MKKSAVFIGISAAVSILLALSPAHAMNWEGHDDWFLNAEPFASFTELLPPPLPAPLPRCAERRRASESNPYEQTAIPSVNCVETPNLPSKREK